MKVGRNLKQNERNLDTWYQHHKYRTKDIKEYITYLTLLLDEVLAHIAHVCREIRELEGRR